MAALIGALRVSLSADTANFETGMKRAQRQAQSSAGGIQKSMGVIKGALAGLAAGLSVGLFVNVIKGALNYAASLADVASQLGVTTRELQTFRYAAQQNGVSVEQADKGLQKLTLSLSKAQAGSKPVIAAFNAVGVSLDDIKNKGAVEIFGQMADGMIKTGGASKNAAAGAVVMGREFQKLVPLADQGSAGLNQLARAAEELGIVLSDEQIAKADETADKLDALQTVLKAQIAGVVADNADSILQLADAIAQVAREAANGIGYLRKFYQEARIAANEAENALSRRFDAGVLGQLGIGNAARAKNRAGNDAETTNIRKEQADARFSALFRGRPKQKAPRQPAGNPSQFLAGGGGGGSKKGRAPKQDRSAERALTDAFRFDQDIRRAQQDVLQALRDLLSDAIERYAISVQIKDAEKASYEAELQYQTALFKLTKGEQGLSEAQTAQLKIQYDIRDDLERKKLIADESARAAEESAKLDDLNFDLERDRLQSVEQLATTAREQRDIQLRLLDLSYEQERIRLETVLADKMTSEAAKEEARRRLLNLQATQGNDRQSVLNGTRGPLEDYMSQLPTTTDQWNESLENVAANGLQAVEDGIVDILTGAKSVGDALKSILAGIIEQLIRIGVQKMIGMAIGGGFASGGYTGGGGKYEPAGIVHRREFVFNSESTSRLGVPFLEALQAGKVPGMARGGFVGLPIARAPRSNMHMASDGQGMGGGATINAPITIMGNASRETVGQIEAAVRRQVANASRR